MFKNTLLFIMLCPLILVAQAPQANFSLSKSSGCVPLQVQFTNHSTNANSFKWHFGDGSSSTLHSPSKTYLNLNTYDVSLIAYGSQGQNDTLYLQDAVTVRDTPTVGFSWALLDSCAETNQVQFQNHSVGGQLYVWDFGDGQNSHQANPTHHYQQAGSYMVNLLVIDTLGCSRLGSANKALIIRPNPSAQFTPNKLIQCNPSDSIHFMSQGQNISQYQWNFGDGQSTSQAGPSVQYQDTGSFFVSLLVSNQFGCQALDTLSQPILSLDLKLPQIQLNDTLGCSPLALQASAQTFNQTNYQWLTNNTPIGNSPSLDTVINLSGSYELSLISMQHQVCIDTQKVHTNIQVLPSPQAQFEVDSLNHCVNGQLNFRPLNTAQTYVWKFGDGQTSSLASPWHSYDSAKSYHIELQVENNYQCRDTSSQTINIQYFEGKVNATPKSGCLPLSVQFSDSSLQANSWKWIFDDGDTSYLQHPQHTYQSSGNFYPRVELQTPNGCLDTATVKGGVTVSADTIDLDGDTLYSCSPTAINFNHLNLGNTFWVWHFGNGDTSLQQKPSYRFQQAGTYTLSLQTENSFGCPTLYTNIATYVVEEIQVDPRILYFDCSLGMVGFTDSTQNAVSWFWDFGDGNSSNLQSPGHIYSDTLLYHLSLTVTNASGCQKTVFFPNLIDMGNCLLGGGGIVDTANSNSSSATMNFTYNSSGNGATACAPQTVQFSSQSDSANAYFWDFGDGNSSSQMNPEHTYYQNGIYDVKLIEQHGNLFDTTFYPALIRVNSPSSKISRKLFYNCDSVNSLLFPSTVPETWYWSSMDHDSLVTDTLRKTYPYGPKVYTVTLKASDSIGCKATNLSTFNFQLPTFDFQHKDSVCIGEPLLFSSDDSLRTYFWEMGNGDTASSTHEYRYIYQQAGFYQPKVIGFDSLGCADTLVLDSIKVKGARANFATLPDTLCQNEALQTQAYDSTADRYNWLINDSLISTGQNLNYERLSSGELELKLQTMKNGCSHTVVDSSLFIKPINTDFILRQLNACLPIQVLLEDTAANRTSRSWSINGQSIGTADSLVYSLSQLYTLIVELSATNQNGCQGSSSRQLIPQLLKAKLQVSDTVACAPASIQFTSQSTLADSLIWDFGDGTSSAHRNPVHTYDSTGSYTVSLVALDQTGCTDTLVKESHIQVEGLNAEFSAQFTPSCAPMMVHFSSESSEAITWQWSFGDGGSSTLENPTYTYHNSGFYNVKLMVENTTGCRDTLQKSKYIQVPGPITYFGISDSLLCGSSEVSFYDSSQNAVSWQWDFGDGHSSQQQNPTHQYQDTGSYQVLLITTDSSGCNGYYQLPQKIKVSHQPTADYSLNESQGCTPFLIEAQNRSIDATNFQWRLNNQLLDTTRELHQSILDSGHYQLQLISISQLGCRDTADQSITVDHTPNPSIFGPTEICFNQAPFEFSAADSNGCWHGKGLKSNEKGFFKPLHNDSHFDTLIYHFDGKCPVSDTHIVKVKASPKAQIQVSQKEACMNLNTNLKASFTSQSDTSFVAFKWFANQQLISSKKEFAYHFGPGNYDLTLVVEPLNQCYDTLHFPNYLIVHDSIPYRLDIQKVDVLNPSQIMLSWDSIKDQSFQELQVYRKRSDQDQYSQVAVIQDKRSTFFLDGGLETTHYSYCYKVVPVDRCQQQFNLSQLQAHCSIELKSQLLDKHSVRLSWNSYQGKNITNYSIYRFDPSSGQTEQLTNLSWRENSFIDTTAYCNTEYSYQLKAKLDHQNVLFSHSDIAKARTKGLFYQEEVRLIRSTVKQNKSIGLEWESTTFQHPAVMGYHIYRKSKSLDHYERIHSLPLGNNEYLDSEVDVQAEQYTYKVGLASSCAVDGVPEKQSSPILLKATQINNKKGKLDWSQYQIDSRKVEHYELQKRDESGQWKKVKIIPAEKGSTEVDF
ncbi:MAG: PKD domain-containing protein [Vicingaceae bacterium]